VPAEPVERHGGYMRRAAPGMLKLGTEADDEQHRQLCDPVDRKVEQFARGRVDPMRVFKNHKNRVKAREGFELMQQGFEQHLAPTLRAEVEPRAGIRQRQQLGDELHFVPAWRRRRKQFA